MIAGCEDLKMLLLLQENCISCVNLRIKKNANKIPASHNKSSESDQKNLIAQLKPKGGINSASGDADE